MELDELLLSLRNQIDTIDEEMIYLLSRRLELVKQVGAIKREIGAPPLQQERWNSLLENLYKEADDKGVNRKLVFEIWSSIHKEALRLEE